jgi:hypothetical protein
MITLPDKNAPDQELIKTALMVLGVVINNQARRERRYHLLPDNVSVYPSSYDTPTSMPIVRVWGDRPQVEWEVDWQDGTPKIKRDYRF